MVSKLTRDKIVIKLITCNNLHLLSSKITRLVNVIIKTIVIIGCSVFYFAFVTTQVRESLILTLTDQRIVSQKAVQLMSGSLYQATQVTNEVSLEAQVNNNRNTVDIMYSELSQSGHHCKADMVGWS